MDLWTDIDTKVEMYLQLGIENKLFYRSLTILLFSTWISNILIK